MTHNHAFETDAAQRCALHGVAQRPRVASPMRVNYLLAILGESEQGDGRRQAELPDLPCVLAYGTNRDEAISSNASNTTGRDRCAPRLMSRLHELVAF